MASVSFDTLKFAKRLEAAGVSARQAEATAEAFAEATSQELATKADLALLETRLSARIDALDMKLGAMDGKLGALETRLVLKVG